MYPFFHDRIEQKQQRYNRIGIQNIAFALLQAAAATAAFFFVSEIIQQSNTGQARVVESGKLDPHLTCK